MNFQKKVKFPKITFTSQNIINYVLLSLIIIGGFLTSCSDKDKEIIEPVLQPQDTISAPLPTDTVTSPPSDTISSPDTTTTSELSLIFTDDFESGTLQSNDKKSFHWKADDGYIQTSPNGSKGLEFAYGPDKVEDDSWKEVRFELGKGYSELMIEYDLYIPENFRHRYPSLYTLTKSPADFMAGDTVYWVSQEAGSSSYITKSPEHWGIVYEHTGERVRIDQMKSNYMFNDGHYMKNSRTGEICQVSKRHGFSHNNKFITVWEGEYSTSKSGNTVFLSFWNTGRGNSVLSYELAKDNGEWRKGQTFVETGNIFEMNKDRGNWLKIKIHVKIASEANNDGILTLWKNGEKHLHLENIANHSEKGFNYFERGYLLGWANSGYDEKTTFYIDNISFRGK